METKIEPCKCGASSKVGENWYDYPHIHKTIYWISCERCGKAGDCYDYRERNEAISVWNAMQKEQDK